MRTIKLLSATILTACLCACSNVWDDHYNPKEDVVDGTNIQSVAMTATEFLKSETSLSSMYTLFSEAGVIETMSKKDQLFTILVVPNGATTNQDDKDYLAKTHISDIAISPSNLINGQRVLMWNGKYLEVQKTETTTGTTFAFNGTKVKKIIKTINGFIYELEAYAYAPKSMYEFIAGLDDSYSVFREMILSRNQKTFDKNASIPKGVDNTGRTVYDSIFTITNPYFAAQGFDIMSESVNATVLVPSNAVVSEALSKARADLNSWGMTRVDSIIENWIFQAAFFNKKYSKQDFEATTDLTSIFKKQWRTTIQQADLDNPVEMSNGVAYYVKWMKIPTNVLIFRLKDYLHYYEKLNEAEKALYYGETNLIFEKCNTDVTEWSGWPGYFPNIINRVLIYKHADQTIDTSELAFTPFQFKDHGNGLYTVAAYKVPPGEYDLCLGFKQSIKCDIGVYFNDVLVTNITAANLATTTYHYDRNGQGYPEGYDTTKATNSKKANYDRDGGKAGVVTIGGTVPAEVKITFKFKSYDAEGSRRATLHHWCLKPTTNCY